MSGKDRGGAEDGNDIDVIADQITCMTLHKREPPKRGEGNVSCEKYDSWRQKQKTRATRLQKQLKARSTLEQLIEDQLNRFHTHYNRAMGRARLKDVAQLLMPKEAPVHELAALGWLGDWRPSAILVLLRSLARSSSSRPVGVEQALSQLIQEIAIEEVVLDEEMAEIQANCVLHLPFGPVQADGPALARVQSEFKKILQVITKAQNLRFNSLELVVKKVLSQSDAAEFLVAFAGIQDLIHQLATQKNYERVQSRCLSRPWGCS